MIGLRVSSHNVFIETRRRSKVEVNKRTCLFCAGPFEDEIHFITECKTCYHLGKKLYDKICQKYRLFLDLDVKDKFILLKEPYIIAKEVDSFIFDAMIEIA